MPPKPLKDFMAPKPLRVGLFCLLFSFPVDISFTKSYKNNTLFSLTLSPQCPLQALQIFYLPNFTLIIPSKPPDAKQCPSLLKAKLDTDFS